MNLLSRYTTFVSIPQGPINTPNVMKHNLHLNQVSIPQGPINTQHGGSSIHYSLVSIQQGPINTKTPKIENGTFRVVKIQI